MSVGTAADTRPSDDAPAPGRPFQARPVQGAPHLAVIVYHYVGETERDRFPRLHAVSVDAFAFQLRSLSERYEMASLESALAFLAGDYTPPRSLCLLTFDDGLMGHYTTVLPILAEASVQGLFFASTDCLDGRVADVHKNHCLMSGLEFEDYRRRLLDRIAACRPDLAVQVDPTRVRQAYPWDPIRHAEIKYLLNYELPADVRAEILSAVFREVFHDEREVARTLYLTRDHLHEMQQAGMLLGGHGHAHVPLTSLPPSGRRADLETCARRLEAELGAQALRPFSYPYGRWSVGAAGDVRATGFDCAFALDGGANQTGQHAFAIRRIDTKDLVF